MSGYQGRGRQAPNTFDFDIVADQVAVPKKHREEDLWACRLKRSHGVQSSAQSHCGTTEGVALDPVVAENSVSRHPWLVEFCSQISLETKRASLVILQNYFCQL